MEYATFIVLNLHKVTSGLKVMLSPGLQMTFNEIVTTDKSLAMTVFWMMLQQGNYELYIFQEDNKLIGFAVMEPSRLLRYLYVDDSNQNQGFGRQIINFFKQNGSFRVRIEDKEYKNGLQKFYEKNGFIFFKKEIVLGTMYYEYKLTI